MRRDSRSPYDVGSEPLAIADVPMAGLEFRAYASTAADFVELLIIDGLVVLVIAHEGTFPRAESGARQSRLLRFLSGS